jgi:hypothetical protein
MTGQRMSEYWSYIADQFQFSPSLTINAGLRYEYFGVDHEVLSPAERVTFPPVAAASLSE